MTPWCASSFVHDSALKTLWEMVQDYWSRGVNVCFVKLRPPLKRQFVNAEIIPPSGNHMLFPSIHQGKCHEVKPPPHDDRSRERERERERRVTCKKQFNLIFIVLMNIKYGQLLLTARQSIQRRNPTLLTLKLKWKRTARKTKPQLPRQGALAVHGK